MTTFEPRLGQDEVLAFAGGRMGISAVPGSGKTRTLAELAAQLVEVVIAEDQEVLVVTLVNSAVDNLKRRIRESLHGRHLLPGFGYRVRTLHGLAHDIVRERPGLVGLAEDFRIIDEREAELIREDAVDAWLRAYPDAAELYLKPDVPTAEIAWIKRKHWPNLIRVIATSFIKRAKDMQLTPGVLLERLRQTEAQSPDLTGLPSLPLARVGAEIYGDYQRSLSYRGVVDFDDLIRLALEALRRDPDYLLRLQRRWPHILEDEAQDSSQAQEQILRLLVGETGNWVRVGDPNQAIYETFTNARPRFLREYVRQSGVKQVTLGQSGRSQPAIVELANFLVDWTLRDHPAPSAQSAFEPQHIEPTHPGDPQPNPPFDPAGICLVDHEFSPLAELEAVADSLQRWLPDNRNRSVAVLVPRNERGFELLDLLRKRGIDYVELLRSTTATRHTAGSLGNLLRCLADPTSARKLSDVFRVWRRDERDDPELRHTLAAVARRIAGCPAVEAYLWPRAEHDWLPALLDQGDGEAAAASGLATSSTGGFAIPEDQISLLDSFREVARRWHRAAVLPINELLLTLAGDLFREPAELALAHKLAVLLRDVADAHPGYRLVELSEELAVIARNERRFLGFTGEEAAFEPPKGQVTVTTMHKAKGLEWDRVYLMSVNDYDFPSGLAGDSYIGEKWFVRDSLNLEAEALAQLDLFGEAVGRPRRYQEGQATEQARLAYVNERLRLLYVGITRARNDLIITWNTGRSRSSKHQPAVPLLALLEHWQKPGARELPADG